MSAHGFPFASAQSFGVQSPHGFRGGNPWASVWALEVGNKCLWAYDTGANVYAVCVDRFGYLWVAGDFGNGGNNLFKLTADGSLVLALSTAPYPILNMAVDYDGNIYAGGGVNGNSFSPGVGRVWSFDKDGNPRWQVDPLIDIAAAIAIDPLLAFGSSVLVGRPFNLSHPFTVANASLDAATGATNWLNNSFTYEACASEGNFYVGGSAGAFLDQPALQIATTDGSIVHNYDYVAMGGIVVDDSANVFLMNTKQGQIVPTGFTALKPDGSVWWSDTTSHYGGPTVPPLGSINSFIFSGDRFGMPLLLMQTTSGFQAVHTYTGISSWTWPYLLTNPGFVSGTQRVGGGYSPGGMAYLGSVRTIRAGIPIG